MKTDSDSTIWIYIQTQAKTEVKVYLLIAAYTKIKYENVTHSQYNIANSQYYIAKHFAPVTDLFSLFNFYVAYVVGR